MSYISEKYGITPGPWEVYKSVYDRPCVGQPMQDAKGFYPIADMVNDNDRAKANARAIAEVPAMIEALEEAHETLDAITPTTYGDDVARTNMRNQIDAILARIKGA